MTASSDSAFVEQLLQERLDAAVAQDPSLAAMARPGSSYDAPSSSSGSSGLRLGIATSWPCREDRLASRREVEHGADVTAQAEPPYRSGQGIREQIGAGEPYAGNPIPDQDRSRRQVEPVEYPRGQEV